MHFLHVTLLSCVLNIISADPALEVTSIMAKPATITNVVPVAVNLMLQSNDGGLTWNDISQTLPGNEPGDLFEGESDLYLGVKNEMYRSKGGLPTPVWEKVTVDVPAAGVMAFNYSEGQVYQQLPDKTWSPIGARFKTPSMPLIFEASGGTLFYSSDGGLYRSVDKGRSWKTVIKARGIATLVEENNVLVGACQAGIVRSTDNGETWEPVISEGGVGIALERIDGGIAAISYCVSSKTRRIRLSSDNGKTWSAIDEGLESLSISSLKQMGKYLIVGHPDGIYRSADMGKTWNLVHPSGGNVFKNVNSSSDSVQVGNGANTSSDEKEKVFQIHAFGKTLYAVARPFGC